MRHRELKPDRTGHGELRLDGTEMEQGALKPAGRDGDRMGRTATGLDGDET